MQARRVIAALLTHSFRLAVLVAAITVVAAGPARASVLASTALPAPAQVSGLTARPLTRAAIHAWLTALHPGVRRLIRGAVAARGFRGGPVQVVVWAAATAGPGAARQLERALHGRGRVVLAVDNIAAEVTGHGPGAAGLETTVAAVVAADLRAAAAQSPWTRLLDRVAAHGPVTPTEAAQAFSMAIAPLPGVKIPKGAPGPISSGTLAVRWLMRVLPRLPGAQRAAALRVLNPFANATAHAASPVEDTAYEAIASAAADEIAKNLGVALKLKIYVYRGALVHMGADAETVPHDANGTQTPPLTRCDITVGPKGQAFTGPDLVATLTHEVFHCYQVQLAGLERYDANPDWLMEGSANWVACQLVGSAGDFTGWYKAYLQSPRTGLFDDTYESMGFFAQAWFVGAPLWQRWQAAFQQAANEDEYNAIIGGEEPKLLDSWGSSFVRESQRGIFWNAYAPCIPGESSPPWPVNVLQGGSRTVTVDAHSSGTWALSSETGALSITTSDAARLSSLPVQIDTTQVNGERLCLDEELCHCPDQPTQSDGLTYAPDPVLALSAAAKDASATIAAIDTTNMCKKPPPPSPNQGGTGGSFGDPYVTTFDGSRVGTQGYAFQTSGEFTLVKSTTDSLEIQGRLQPFPTGGVYRNDVAMNTAFAMRDGGAVVEVDNPTSNIGQPGALVLYLDRQRVSARSGQSMTVAGGGRVRYTPLQVTVSWPDGTVADVYRMLIHYGVNISVKPSRQRAGRLAGLFGNDDGKPNNDFVGRDGHVYPAAVVEKFGVETSSARARHIVLDEFGASWRITPATSLFVYPPGKNTYSYIVKGFPFRTLSQRSLTGRQLAEARAACERAHVTNTALLGGCIVDVGATGNRQLAASAGAFQRATGLRAPSTGGGLSGRWSGRYSGAFNGTFVLDWTQSGSRLDGKIKLSNPRRTLGIGGSVSGSTIRFGAVGFVTYSGSVNGDSMSGTYSSPRGGGSWSATKVS